MSSGRDGDDTMKQTLFQEKYPVFTVEINKTDTTYQSVDEIIGYLKQCVDEHRVARYIGEFDHYSHTEGLEEGQIAEDILDAKCIIFCFGIALPNPQVMAVRPRSIGVVEMATSFIITFMEAPMPVANIAMEDWATSIQNRAEA
jgi:hypothetical protein